MQEDFVPKGTWVFALIFLVLLALIWGTVYYMLLQHGPTM